MAFRVTSLVLLCCYAFVVMLFTRRLVERLQPDADLDRRRSIAFLAACLVAVHPILNESVLLASSRSSLLLAVFGMAALAVMVKKEPGSHDAAMITGLTTAACLTKETVVVLLPLAGLLVLLPGGSVSSWAGRVRRVSFVAVPVLLYVLFYETAFQWLQAGGPRTPVPVSLMSSTSATAYPATGGLALLGLAGLIARPFAMSLVHSLPPPEGALRVLGYLVWPAAFVAGVVLVRRVRGVRLAGFAILWFTVALAPALVLVPLNTPFAEHRAVIGVVGPFVAIAYALDSLRAGWGKRSVVFLLVLLLAVAAAAQTLQWRSPLTLWRHETRNQPKNPRGWGFLADILYERNELDGARTAILRALALAPANPIYLGRAGMIELLSGRPDAAEAYLRRGLAIEDKLPMLHLGEAERLAVAGQLGRAEGHARRAVALDPRMSDAWNALGNVLYMQGKRNEARDAYGEAVRLNPGNEVARKNMNMTNVGQ